MRKMELCILTIFAVLMVGALSLSACKSEPPSKGEVRTKEQSSKNVYTFDHDKNPDSYDYIKIKVPGTDRLLRCVRYNGGASESLSCDWVAFHDIPSRGDGTGVFP